MTARYDSNVNKITSRFVSIGLLKHLDLRTFPSLSRDSPEQLYEILTEDD